MQSSLTRWRSLFFLVALIVTVGGGIWVFQPAPAALDAELVRDLGMVDPAEVGISAARLERLDASPTRSAHSTSTRATRSSSTRFSGSTR